MSANQPVRSSRLQHDEIGPLGQVLFNLALSV